MAALAALREIPARVTKWGKTRDASIGSLVVCGDQIITGLDGNR
jgi:hypothetical protein